MDSPNWYRLENETEIDSPALLIYPDRILENLRRMILIAGGADRLRPHIKTHKMAEIIRMQLEMGVSRFKCATIAEAEILASSGAPDVLLAYQPVGPKLQRLINLSGNYPATRFSILTDSAEALQNISDTCEASGYPLAVYIDLDVGMHRTGIAPDGARALYELIASLPRLTFGGLHVYDGHIRDTDPALRKQRCDTTFSQVESLQAAWTAAKINIPEIICGGTPTFPIHAKREGIILSPGTVVLWDGGYSRMLPDLEFLHAAVVLTRVISKPGTDRLCLDLGHKSIAAENPHPRVYLKEMDQIEFLGQSEEHLVLSCANREVWSVGDAVYGIPHHICPTTALYEAVQVVRDGQAQDTWRVEARARKLEV